MKIILFPLLILINSYAGATELVCFVVSSITLENMGQKLDHEITDTEKLKDPEKYIHFDLKGGKTSYFWVAPNGTKTRGTDTLKKVDGTLYYGKYQQDSQANYTSYLFEQNLKGGLLTESNFVSYFHCEKSSLSKVEKKHGIPFSQFK